MGSHRRTWGDMARIRFCPVSEGAFAEEVVAANRLRVARPGPPLRKVDLIDPGIDPVLDRMRWADEHIVGPIDVRPPERPDQRERTRPLFERLQQNQDFDAMVNLTARYLSLFCTGARRDRSPQLGHRLNAIDGCKTRFWHRQICLSINNVEAMTIGEQFDGERWHTLGFISANPSDLDPDVILPQEARTAGVFLAPAFYETVGPVYQIGFDSVEAIWTALEDDGVLDLIGGLAMRLMKRGRGLYGRFHDYNLADVILAMDGSCAISEPEAAGRRDSNPRRRFRALQPLSRRPQSTTIRHLPGCVGRQNSIAYGPPNWIRTTFQSVANYASLFCVAAVVRTRRDRPVTSPPGDQCAGRTSGPIAADRDHIPGERRDRYR